MSKTVDQRVVEMRFDNNQFEKGIAQSIGSINNLKASLNFGDSVSKSDINSLTSSLNGIGSSVENISNKFSAMGVMAATALATVTNHVINLGIAWAQNMMGDIEAGFHRYEDMMSSVQTIMYATRQDWADQGAQMDYVTSCIDRLNWYTDETSYNLTDMTSSIGKFVSAGVPLDDAVVDMMGIASWAAISGQNAEKASYAMYNLSQAMAMGKLTNLDWKSIENANMATREFKQTAIDTATALGTLWEGADGLIYGFDQYGHEIEVNVDNFRTTLAGGWLDRDVLTKTLKVYGDFANVLGGYTEDLGISTTELLKYVDQAVDVDLSNMSAEDANRWISNLVSKEHIKNAQLFSEALRELSSEEYELGRAAFKAGQESKTLQDSLDYTADAVHTLWMNIFQDIFGNYLESKELWTEFSELLYEQVVEPLEEVEAIFSSWNSFGGAENLKDAFWNIYETFANVQRAIKEGFNEVFEGFTGLDLAKLTNKFERFTESIKVEKVGYAFKNVKDAAEALAGVLNNLKKNLKTIADAAKKAWDRIFPEDKSKTKLRAVDSLTAAIRRGAEGLKELSDKFVLTDKQASKLERTFAGVFAILDILRMLFVAILEPFSNINIETKNYTDNVLDVTASIGDWLVALRDWIAENDIFTKAVAQVIEWISQIPVYAEMASQALFGLSLNELWDKIVEGATYALGAVVYFFTHLPELAEEACQLLFHTDLATFWENLKGWIQETWEAVLEFFEQLPEKISSVTEFMFQSDFHTWWENIKTWVGEAWDKVQEFFANLPAYIDYAKHKLEELWDIVKKIFKEEIPAKLDEIAQKIFDKPWAEVIQDIKDSIQRLKDAWNDFWGIGEKFNPPEYEELDPDKMWFLDAAWYRNLGKEMQAPKSGLDKLKDNWEDFYEMIGTDLGQWLSDHKWEAAGVITLAVFAGIILLITNLVKSFMNLAVTLEDFDLNLFESSTTRLVGALDDFVEACTLLVKKLPKLIPMIQFKLVADSILEVAAAIFVLGLMDYDKLAVSVGVIISIFVGIFAMFNELSKIENIQAIGINVLEVCTGLLMVAGGLAILAQLPVGQIAAAAIALETAFACILGFFVLISKLKIDGQYLLTISAAMLIASVGIMAMGQAIAFMAGMDPMNIITAADAIALLMGALAGVMIVLSKTETGTATMLAFGAAVALIGVGAMAAGLGIKLVADAISELIGQGTEGIDNIIYGLVSFFDILPYLSEQAAKAFVSFIKVFVDNKDTLLAGLQLMLDLIVTSIIGVMPKIIELGTQIFIGLLQAGIDSMPKIVEFLQTLFDTIVDLTIGWTPRIIDTIIFVVRELLRSMVVLTPEITAAALAILVDTLTQLAENIGVITEMLVRILIETILGTIDGITAELPHIMESIWNFVITLIETFADGLDEHATQLRDAIIHLMESMWNAIKEFFGIHSPSTKFFDMAGDMIQGMIDGLKAMIEKAKTAITELADKVLTKICDFFGVKKPGDANEFLNLGKTIINKFIDGIKDKIEAAKEKIKELADAVLTKICDFFGIKKPESQNEFLNLGKTIIQKFNQGIYNMVTKAKNMIQDFAKKVLNAVCSFFGVETPGSVGELYGIAQQLINGFISGVKSKVTSAINTVGSFCTDVINKCKNVFDINSPSKVFMEIGQYVDEGLAVGIDKYSKTVTDATEDMGYNAIDSISNVLANISDYVNGEMDADPTIRPVLDLSDVTAGAQTINDLLSGDRAMNMASSSSMSMNTALANQTTTQMMLDELRDALSGLGENNESVVNNNTFNISGSNPKEIADEINKILHEQMVREDSVWA